MKKIIAFILSIITISTALTATSAEIPRESTPLTATEEQTLIVERLIGDVLDRVASGKVGYGIASSEADKCIRNAVFADEISGYGYGILSAIANNALRVTRDRVLRPETYAQYEEYWRILLADILTDISKGRDMDKAQEAAYLRIYQAVNPTYIPREVGTDFCYMDTPAIDMAMFNITRKLLLESRP